MVLVSNLALALYLIGIIAFLFNGVNLSYNFDDLVGSNLTLLILPLAGAESAVALALLVAFYPLRGSI
ncbi:NADH dehydrogenase subunit 4L [Powellomyces hirtus]|nr:NADH dehydrogenase subunit 4L [Powellomyces hirtus]